MFDIVEEYMLKLDQYLTAGPCWDSEDIQELKNKLDAMREQMTEEDLKRVDVAVKRLYG